MTSIENNNNLFHRIKNILQNFRVITMIIVMLFAWLIIITIFNTSTPFFVVSSRSMVPVLDVGDIIIVNGNENYEDLDVGDIIVFNMPPRNERVIVHRIDQMIIDRNELGLITKGDNNLRIDSWIVKHHDYIGKVIYQIPSIGYLAIWLAPPINYFLIAAVLILMIYLEVNKNQGNEENQGNELMSVDS